MDTNNSVIEGDSRLKRILNQKGLKESDLVRMVRKKFGKSESYTRELLYGNRKMDVYDKVIMSFTLNVKYHAFN